METLQAQVTKIETQLENWGTRVDELVVEAREAFLAARATYRQRTDDLKTKHRAAKFELDELRAEVDGVGAEANEVDRKTIDDLRAMHRAAQSRLDELLAAGGGKWDSLEVDAASVWDEPEADGGSHEPNVAKIEAQLAAWADQLDRLVAGYLKAGAQPHDGYRLRIDHLRARHEAVRARLTEFNLPTGNGARPWGTFRAEIEDDWTTLEDGFEDLTR